MTDTFPILISTLPTKQAFGICVDESRIYVADWINGLYIFGTVPHLQFLGRVEGGTPCVPITIEAATSLGPQAIWTPILTTNCPTEPFEFSDSPLPEQQRFYRAWQPVP